MKKRVVFYLMAISAVLLSCNRNTLYNKYNHTPVSGWEKNDTLFFDVPPIEFPGAFSNQLGLRINGAYPFTGLTLIVEQTVLPEKSVYTDTLNCSLINSDNGRPLGQGISYYQYNFKIRDIDLQQGDSLHISVRHDMKREILPGISDVGVEIKRN